MKRLVVHIGCAKGGSTAIQTGLRLNHEALLRQGVWVPSEDLAPESEVTGVHGDYFQSFVRDRKAMEIPDLHDKLDAQMAGNGASTVVISAENLSNPMGFEERLAPLAAHFDISIVLYVRRQDEFLEAAWQQWEVKRGASLLSWMIKCTGIHGNWLEIVSPWAAVFGDERIVARVYDRRRLVGGDAFLDFCSVLDVDAARFWLPGELNASFTSLLSRVVEGRPYYFDGTHDDDFYASVRELAADVVLKGPASPPLFEAEEAAEIMARYRKSNERFRQRFLPNWQGPLFPEKHRERSTRSVRDVAAFERELLQLQVFNLHKKLRDATALRLVAPANGPSHPEDPGDENGRL